jgi:hypothetical protein
MAAMASLHLQKLLDTMQMYAEGKGLIFHNYSQAFMGHSDIESTYSFKKSQLPLI